MVVIHGAALNTAGAGADAVSSAVTPSAPAPPPSFFMGDDAWGLLLNAGRWNGVEVSAISWLRPEDSPSPFAYTTGQH